MKISVEANIGAGKTSLLTKLMGKVSFPIILEPIQKWNAGLSLFYEDQTRWAFTFNINVLHSYRQLHISEDVIYERSPFTCRHIFTQLSHDRGMMNNYEMSLFSEIYESIGWSPDAIIYIRTNPMTCMKRVKQRNRQCENDMTMEYLQSVHDKYEQLMTDTNIPVYVIDGNKDEFEVFEQTLNLFTMHSF